jgi:hypothetical protein
LSLCCNWRAVFCEWTESPLFQAVGGGLLQEGRSADDFQRFDFPFCSDAEIEYDRALDSCGLSSKRICRKRFVIDMLLDILGTHLNRFLRMQGVSDDCREQKGISEKSIHARHAFPDPL